MKYYYSVEELKMISDGKYPVFGWKYYAFFLTYISFFLIIVFTFKPDVSKDADYVALKKNTTINYK